MTVIASCTAHIPIISILSTTSNCYIFSRLSFQIFCLIPINSYIFNKLESIHKTFIIFRNISSHLQWTVHSYIKSQLTCQSCTCMRLIIRIHLTAIRFKNSRSIIHRTTNKTSKRQNCCMIYIVSTKRFIFSSAS